MISTRERVSELAQLFHDAVIEYVSKNQDDPTRPSWDQVNDYQQRFLRLLKGQPESPRPNESGVTRSYTSKPGKHSPALHRFEGLGMLLNFQDGPVSQQGRNGTTNEDVIQVVVDRLNSLQEMRDRKYACRENALAITHLEEALHWLQARTAARIARGVEGILEP